MSRFTVHREIFEHESNTNSANGMLPVIAYYAPVCDIMSTRASCLCLEQICTNIPL